ncbi:winged helix-turn-helix transcriptional regulator, partial [Kitasatospora sp. NPDC057518]|uniref:winged helix-turn-helix transcriptional regulator n=1 Tax=Kitasatospora sp. NPDC057518 TaxID=3346155 RepID=UPI0036AFFD3A
MLSTRIAELTEAGLLAPHDDAYRLTPLGADLVTALGPLTAWSHRWAAETEPPGGQFARVSLQGGAHH